MKAATRTLTLTLACLAAAGCASKGPTENGKHLVYRDKGGAPTLQVDYPTEAFCRQVEAVAASNSRCERASSADKLMAQATLRYDPPGMDVIGHYPDMASCQRANSQMSMGVKLLKPCGMK